MALIKCTQCENEISDKAYICPYCKSTLKDGTSQMLMKRKKNIKWIILPIVTIVVGCTISCIVWSVSDGKLNKKASNSYSSYKSDYGTYDSDYTYTPTTGKEGALAQAKSYLRSQAFSYKGLIEQLEYHGYSNYEATYGADNCGADWKEQAVKKAKSYIRSQAFSYKRLIEQLEYGGFTSDEATYGADHCAADWNEQAVKQAKSYLRSSSRWTRSKLIDQLEYGGFTYSQAVYGVDNCGESW